MHMPCRRGVWPPLGTCHTPCVTPALPVPVPTHRFGRDAKSYGMATGLFGQSSCEEVALRQLRETAKAATRFLQRDGGPLGEEEVLMVGRLAVDGWQLTWRLTVGTCVRACCSPVVGGLDCLRCCLRHAAAPNNQLRRCRWPGAPPSYPLCPPPCLRPHPYTLLGARQRPGGGWSGAVLPPDGGWVGVVCLFW